MAQVEHTKINFLYNQPMMLGSGFMCTRGQHDAFERLGVLNYAFDTMGDEFIDEDRFRACPIFYIRGFLPGRNPWIEKGGDQFKATLQSESFYTRHGKLDASSTHIREREKLFGLMITFADTDVDIYRIPTIWMPSWADITVMDERGTPEFEKLGFIGGRPGREDFLNQDKHKILQCQQSELVRDPYLNARKYAELISKFRILVAPPGRFFNSMTGRVFEILSCRRLCLAYMNDETMFRHKELFTDGEDIVYFRTFAEMEERYHYYLKNVDEAERIATNGYNKVRQYFNQDVMAKFIADAVINAANGRYDLVKDFSYQNEMATA